MSDLEVSGHARRQSYYADKARRWQSRCECGWQSFDETHADHLASLGADFGLGVRGARITPADRVYTGPDFSDEACGFVRGPESSCTCYRDGEWGPVPCARCEADEEDA